MKFKITQKEFNNTINYVEKAVSSKNTMPILKGIYLEAEKNKGLHLIATDLELGIECWVAADVIEEGNIVLPSSYLSNLIRELPDEIVNIEVDSESFEATLKCSNSIFEIKGFDPEEFPQLPEVEEAQEFNLPAQSFNNQIDKVKFSIATDESQPALTGALLEIENNDLRMVSTNTYRLSYSELNLDNNILEGDFKIIIPGKTLNELSRLLPTENEEEEVTISVNSNHASFKFKDINVISRIIEGQFPNYQQVIPNEYNTRIRVNKDEFQHATKRVALIAQNNSNIISISTAASENKINLDAAETETGEGHEEVDIQIEGPDQSIRIDAGYLLDVLKILKKEEIIIDLIGTINPLIVRNEEGYIYLIMPIRSKDE